MDSGTSQREIRPFLRLHHDIDIWKPASLAIYDHLEHRTTWRTRYCQAALQVPREQAILSIQATSLFGGI